MPGTPPIASSPRHAGHKGLFLDRLDVGVADAITGEELPRLVPYGHARYQVRNRVYAPQLGRFLQPDPNASGQTLLEAAAYNGRGLGAIAAAFDLEGRLGDGLNLYQYLGSNPSGRSDPMGLFFGAAMSAFDGNGRSDPFDMVDEYIAEDAGSKAAFLGQLGMGAHSVAVVAATIASWMPIPIVNTLGDLALYALGEQSGAQTAFNVALNMMPGGELGILLGKIGSAAFRSAVHYASKFGAPLLNAGRAAVTFPPQPGPS